MNADAPLTYACRERKPEMVRVLLEDSRADVNLVNLSLFHEDADIPCLKWLIAQRGQQLAWDHVITSFDPKHFDIFELIQRFCRDPRRVIHEIRQELGLPRALPGSLFAIMVFLGEDLLQVKVEEAENVNGPSSAARFFAITSPSHGTSDDSLQPSLPIMQGDHPQC